MSRCAQVGSVIFCHCRKALSRKSSSHCGSSFFREISRMISSLRPFGMKSCSTFVSNPCSYSPEVTSSMILSLSFIVGDKSSNISAIIKNLRPGTEVLGQIPGQAYIMPPIPGFIGGMAGCSSLMSARAHSVVRNMPATDAAFWRATRTTLVGSMTPVESRFSNLSVRAL